MALPDLIKYVAELPTAGAALSNSLPSTPGAGLNFLTNKTTIHLITFIPLTGNRTYDNLLSWGTWFAFDATSLLTSIESSASWINGAQQAARKAIVDGDIGFLTDAGTLKSALFGDKTWHHSEIMGLMELILSSENHGTGSQGHVGGAKFWSIINDQPYK